jgi:hypothetical protein
MALRWAPAAACQWRITVLGVAPPWQDALGALQAEAVALAAKQRRQVGALEERLAAHKEQQQQAEAEQRLVTQQVGPLRVESRGSPAGVLRHET